MKKMQITFFIDSQYFQFFNCLVLISYNYYFCDQLQPCKKQGQARKSKDGRKACLIGFSMVCADFFLVEQIKLDKLVSCQKLQLQFGRGNLLCELFSVILILIKVTGVLM